MYMFEDKSNEIGVSHDNYHWCRITDKLLRHIITCVLFCEVRLEVDV